MDLGGGPTYGPRGAGIQPKICSPPSRPRNRSPEITRHPLPATILVVCSNEGLPNSTTIGKPSAKSGRNWANGGQR